MRVRGRQILKQRETGLLLLSPPRRPVVRGLKGVDHTSPLCAMAQKKKKKKKDGPFAVAIISLFNGHLFQSLFTEFSTSEFQLIFLKTNSNW